MGELHPKVKEAVKAIKLDRERGASQLANEALKALRLAVEESKAETLNGFLKEIKEAGRELALARPSMAPLLNSVGKAVWLIEENSRRLSLKELRAFASSRIGGLILESKASLRRIAELAPKVLRGKTVVTHSFSSTAVEAIKAARAKRAIVSESRPLLEGRRTAVELSRGGVPTTLVVDAALGLFAPKADAALVGCDGILADGSIINKVGTYALGLIAKDNGLPFYVAAETFKVDPRSLLGGGVELEEMDPSEVAAGLPSVEVKNVYFDVTPSRLITGIITEKGILKPGEVEAYAKEHARYARALGL